MKTEDFMNQKASKMTSEELLSAIKIKIKQRTPFLVGTDFAIGNDTFCIAHQREDGMIIVDKIEHTDF